VKHEHDTHFRAFTLIELLVVIGVVAVLMGITLAALRDVRRSAQWNAYLSTARQLHAALAMYGSDFDGYFPFQATKGSPHESVLPCGSWSHDPGIEFFKGQSHFYGCLLVPAYYDGPVDWRIDARDGARDWFFPPPAPERLFTGSFLLTHTAFAAPAYWRDAKPPEDLTLLRGARWSDVASPSAKGVLMFYLDAKGLVSWWENGVITVGLGDGSAGRRTMPPDVRDGEPTFVVRPFGCWQTPVMATRDGLRGRDW
jgi:prepilin-type N-terminal cleavage/methylation domain-containing protein